MLRRMKRNPGNDGAAGGAGDSRTSAIDTMSPRLQPIHTHHSPKRASRRSFRGPAARQRSVAIRDLLEFIERRCGCCLLVWITLFNRVRCADVFGRFEILMILHGSMGIATFIIAIVAQLAYINHPRITLAWTSIPLLYMLWIRFGAAVVRLAIFVKTLQRISVT